MPSRRVLLVCGLLTVCAASALGQDYATSSLDAPVLIGYVTRAVSGSDFDLNGIRILCNKKTRFALESAHGATESGKGCPSDPLFVGEALEVRGEAGSEVNSYLAHRIQSEPWHPGGVSGAAVIGAAPEPEPGGARPAGLLVRADGYRIEITATTQIEWAAPLHSLAEVKAGDWIEYKGRQNAAGVVAAASVRIAPNAIGGGEEKLRSKTDYDPAAVAPHAKQNFLKDAFAGGLDPKKFPPFQNAAMQARIEKIGDSLVPAYQRALPASDPARLDFRFQVIDTKLLRCALSLPSGVILIPHQVVERMQNDSQVATVLADAMARALERQQYRTANARKLAYAGILAGPFVPYAGNGMVLGGSGVESGIVSRETKQSDRVSLALLHDAGYDIDQAPLAWWLLDPWDRKPLAEIPIPDRASYLYRMLGELWNSPAASAAQAH